MPDCSRRGSKRRIWRGLSSRRSTSIFRPHEIDPEAPLFGEGLGPDSIDVLEIALAISQNYGVQLRSDDQTNARIFESLRSLNQDIQRRRAL